MRLDDIEQSANVEDRRGMGGLVRTGGLGVGAVIGLTLLGNILGIDPRLLIGGAEVLTGGRQQQASVQGRRGPAEDELQTFVNRVLRTTEIVWEREFPRQAGAINPQAEGQPYRPPRLVSFTQATPTRCGTGQSAMGPFYCPLDQTVYLDNGFFREMQRRLGGGGQFAYGYVIAHEVGHHIEHQLGILDRVNELKQRVGRKEANELSVRVELMADCLAGVWGFYNRDRLAPGEAEQAMRTASAIGDDNLQRGSGRPVQQETFTHGTSQQRVGWFMRGFRSGRMAECNTFAQRTY